MNQQIELRKKIVQEKTRLIEIIVLMITIAVVFTQGMQISNLQHEIKLIERYNTHVNPNWDGINDNPLKDIKETKAEKIAIWISIVLFIYALYLLFRNIKSGIKIVNMEEEERKKLLLIPPQKPVLSNENEDYIVPK